MKKLSLKKLAVCALACGMSVSAVAFNGVNVFSANAEGKVEIKPYLEYLFNSADTLYDNTGTSASDTTKDYTLQKYGTSKEVDMCYGEQLNLEDNAALYLRGENNPFANGDLEDFTFTMQVKVQHNSNSNWFSAPVSWDSFSGNPDNNADGGYAKHQYTRISTAQNSSNADWIRFTDSQAMNLTSPHWESYYKGKPLYTGDRTAGDSSFVTLMISVDKDSLMTVKAYEGTTEVTTLTYDLTDKNWDTYLADATTKQFTIGSAWDSRNGGKLEMKTFGRIDNVRVYDFAMSETEMSNYANRLKLVVDGIEIDEEIIGGTVSVEDYTPAIGEEVVLNVVPETGSEIGEVTVNGEVVEPVNGVYKTTMVQGGLFVSANFIRSLPVEISDTIVGGTVTADKTMAKVGETVTFTVTPNSGYVLKDVLVNGAPLTPVNKVYSAEMTNDGMEVTAVFNKQVAITIDSAISNGSVTASKSACMKGDRVTFIVTPDAGYVLDKLTVNGVEVKEEDFTYAYIAGDEDMLVSATFKKEGAEQGGNGEGGALGGVLANFGCASSIQGLGMAGMALAGSVVMFIKRKNKK